MRSTPTSGASSRPREARMSAALSSETLRIDCAAEVERISKWMVETVASTLHKRGVIIALSGGVDSSVCGALAVKAFGPKKVFGLLLPEHDSSAASEDLGGQVARQLGIEHVTERIAS